MSEVKCPHCGFHAGNIEKENVTKHFVCDECNSMFHTVKENDEIKVELS